MAQSSVMVSLSSFLWTETLMPPPLTPGGLDRDSRSQAVWTPGKNDGCLVLITAAISSVPTVCRALVSARHSPATPQDPCNNDSHTVGWEAQRQHAGSPRSHSQQAVLDPSTTHFSHDTPLLLVLTQLTMVRSQVPRVTALFAWPPTPAAIRARGGACLDSL